MASVGKDYNEFSDSFKSYFEQAFRKVINTKKNIKKCWVTDSLKHKKSKLVQLSKTVKNPF